MHVDAFTIFSVRDAVMISALFTAILSSCVFELILSMQIKGVYAECDTMVSLIVGTCR